MDESEDFEAVTTDFIRRKILKVLEVYPKISRSMLQVGLGTAVAPKMWSPIFDKLVEDRIIQVSEYSGVSATGRGITYNVISLVPKEHA